MGFGSDMYSSISQSDSGRNAATDSEDTPLKPPPQISTEKVKPKSLSLWFTSIRLIGLARLEGLSNAWKSWSWKWEVAACVLG